jgi:hypothetical protein
MLAMPPIPWLYLFGLALGGAMMICGLLLVAGSAPSGRDRK